LKRQEKGGPGDIKGELPGPILPGWGDRDTFTFMGEEREYLLTVVYDTQTRETFKII